MFENFFLVTFVLMPVVVVLCALLNMLTAWTFSWSELVLDYLAGIALGACFFAGTATDASGVAQVFLVLSQGLFGALHVAGAEAFQPREFLFLLSSGCLLGATLFSGLLDRASLAIGKTMTPGTVLLSVPLLLFKLPFSLITTAIGMLMGLVGAIRAAASTNATVGFINGIYYVEWNNSTASASATTIGSTVHVWHGKLSSLVDHELYHTRQYMYLRDFMIPAWLVGGLWGLISSAIAGRFNICYFSTARHDSEVGNPIERAAYRISGHSAC